MAKVYKNVAREQKIKRYIQYGALVIIVISLITTSIGMLLSFGNYGQLQKQSAVSKLWDRKVSHRNKTLTSVKSNYEKVSDEANNTKFGVSTSGNIDSNVTTETAELSKTFSDMVTYNNGTDYENHRNKLQSIIHDDSFFNDYYKSDKDSTGNSSVDALKLVSRADSVDVFQIGDNTYRVLVTYSSGVKNKTQKQKQMMYDVVGSSGNYSSVKANKGFAPEVG